MVTETTPADVETQEAPAEAEQEAPVEEQVAISEPPTDDVPEPAADEDPEPEALPEPSYDLSTDEGIDALVGSNETLKKRMDQIKADGINEGAQAREKELERDAGSDARVQASAAQWLAALPRDEVTGHIDPTLIQPAHLEYLTKLNMASATGQVFSNVPQAFFREYDIPASAIADANDLGAAGDSVGYWQALVKGATTAKFGSGGYEDIPPDSRLSNEVEAEVTRRVASRMADEAAAALLESQAQPGGAPPTPRGTTTTGVADKTPARQFLDGDITADEYAKVLKAQGLPPILK